MGRFLIPQPYLNLPYRFLKIFTCIICHFKINLNFMFALNFDIIPNPHSKVVHVEKYNYLFWKLRFALPIINISKLSFNFLEF